MKPGDVVALIGGGPLMTIESISSEDAYCIWFISYELMSGTFKRSALQIWVRR